jgi:hypothetical protein
MGNEIKKQNPLKEVDLDYLNSYLDYSASVLKDVCKQLTEHWEKYNMKNTFFLETKAILFEKKYRVKVVIQSVYNGKNVIFYSRQEIISEQLKEYPDVFKQVIKEFVSKVMVDLMKEGIESTRREVINNNRERIAPKDKELEDYLLQYPLKMDDVYPETKDV